MTFASDIAFTPMVKKVQTERGSRQAYAKMEEGSGWPREVSDDLARFLSRADSVYLATASAAGQPYVQHRGGPPGFLKVLDRRTLAFCDFAGNRQYITIGNLAENPRAFIFVMDYANRERVKIWGSARVVALDDPLAMNLLPRGYRARPQQAVAFTIEAWDTNCAQHIPQKIGLEEVRQLAAGYQRTIAALEAEIARLKGCRQQEVASE
jgi:hypothetical protein